MRINDRHSTPIYHSTRYSVVPMLQEKLLTLLRHEPPLRGEQSPLPYKPSAKSDELRFLRKPGAKKARPHQPKQVELHATVAKCMLKPYATPHQYLQPISQPTPRPTAIATINSHYLPGLSRGLEAGIHYAHMHTSPSAKPAFVH
jgi:hypothetical protein